MGRGGRRVIVTNNTVFAAPWADVLFAMDRKWWEHYGQSACEVFGGERATVTRRHRRNKVKCIMVGGKPMQTYGNSGTGAVALAALRGAGRVVLLGYDCQATGGRKHWHADHPSALGNAGSLPKWSEQFRQLMRAVAGKVDVVNATRETALQCFPRMRLEDVL